MYVLQIGNFLNSLTTYTMHMNRAAERRIFLVQIFWTPKGARFPWNIGCRCRSDRRFCIWFIHTDHKLWTIFKPCSVLTFWETTRFSWFSRSDNISEDLAIISLSLVFVIIGFIYVYFVFRIFIITQHLMLLFFNIFLLFWLMAVGWLKNPASVSSGWMLGIYVCGLNIDSTSKTFQSLNSRLSH